MKEKATIYDYGRLCRTVITCDNCSLCAKYNGTNLSCDDLLIKNPDKANEIIINWCKEHPIKTRQSELLKIFPNAKIAVDGALSICPRFVNKDFSCPTPERRCSDCFKEYWLAEVEERHDL